MIVYFLGSVIYNLSSALKMTKLSIFIEDDKYPWLHFLAYEKVKTKKQHYLTIQTFLSSCLLPDGIAPSPASASWTDAVNSNKTTTNKVWICILKHLITSVRASQALYDGLNFSTVLFIKFAGGDLWTLLSA